MDKFNEVYASMISEGLELEPEELKIYNNLVKNLTDNLKKLKKVKTRQELKDILLAIAILGDDADHLTLDI